MTDMTIKKDPAVLAGEIRSLQQQAQVMVLSYSIEIGRRLCEAKAVVPHGQWGEWLKNEVSFSQSTAQGHMNIYRKFSSEQISLFGDAKSQAIGNLTYTKALKLLAVPEDEVEAFMEEHDVADMSTRELEQAIREREEAKEALQTEKAHVESLKESLESAEASALTAKEDAERLRRELENLQKRPVDVAVQEATPEMLAEIRAAEEEKFQQEREALQKRAEDAEAKAKKRAEKVKDLKAAVDKAKEDAKAELQKDMDSAQEARRAAEAEKNAAEARAAELEKKLKLADGDTAVFQIYFQSAQEDCNRMLGMIQKAEPEQAAKFRSAMRALLESVGKSVEVSE